MKLNVCDVFLPEDAEACTNQVHWLETMAEKSRSKARVQVGGIVTALMKNEFFVKRWGLGGGPERFSIKKSSDLGQ